MAHLQFVNISSISEDAYIIVDEDMIYRWNVDATKAKAVWQWLNNRDKYKFDIRYSDDYSHTVITVFYAGECLLREVIETVDYL